MDASNIETGTAAMGGAVVMKLVDYIVRFIPFFNRRISIGNAEAREEIRKDALSVVDAAMNKYVSKEGLKQHKDLCNSELNGQWKLHEQRLNKGEEQFKELTLKMDSNHNQIINILLDIKKG